MSGCERVMVVALAAALAASVLVVDPRAADAFVAPKHALVLLAIGIAAAAAPDPVSLRFLRTGPSARRIAGMLFLVALAAAVVSALVSPRGGASLDALRHLLFYALLVPLGAGRALDGAGGPLLLAVFLAGSAANAALSLLQAQGLFQPVAIASISGRAATGALVGNEGQLSLALALAAIGSIGAAFIARGPSRRAAALGASVLFAAALAMNPSLTALAALAIAGITAGAFTLEPRRWLAAAAAVVLAAALLAALPPISGRVAAAWSSARAGDLDQLLSFRLGAWAAALQMVGERPLTGFGLGSYGAEFVPHRLAAEVRRRIRFVPPTLASSYGEAHNEFLHAAAECGLPAAAAAAGAAGALFLALARAPLHRRGEAAMLAAGLAAGAVAAASWFPLQQPSTAVPLLLAAGRAFRLTGEEDR